MLARDGSLRLLGETDKVTLVQQVLEECLLTIRSGRKLTTQDVGSRLRGGSAVEVGDADLGGDDGARSGARRGPHGREGAHRGPEALPRCDRRARGSCSASGPAGTGKTYLAVAKAVQALKRATTFGASCSYGRRSRPARSWGSCRVTSRPRSIPTCGRCTTPCRTCSDARTRERWLESDVVEVCPLAYMRGRTLNRAFVILDEAQNTTVPQMLMFLTRLGEGSRMVVTGDPSQKDLPPNVKSGLSDAVSRLRQVDGIGVVELHSSDVVRHAVVSRIVDAYGEGPRG